MKLPHAPLYGAFARAWALAEQGIRISFETASSRHFRLEASWPDQRLPTGGGGKIWGDDPDLLLDQMEAAMKDRGVQFTPSREYLAPILET